MLPVLTDVLLKNKDLFNRFDPGTFPFLGRRVVEDILLKLSCILQSPSLSILSKKLLQFLTYLA
jgi:hypothetical protein